MKTRQSGDLLTGSVKARIGIGLCLCLVACGKGRPPLDEAEAFLGDRGLHLEHPRTLSPVPMSASECRGGSIDNLDVMLCTFATAASRARGLKAAELWIAGAVTGSAATRDLDASRVKGTDLYGLVVVADRARVDLSGRAVQKITSAFAGPPRGADPRL